MFDRITYISNDGCDIKLKNGGEVSTNLMNLHLVFEDSNKKVLGEVDDLKGDTVKARFLGEIVGNRLIGGTIRKFYIYTVEAEQSTMSYTTLANESYKTYIVSRPSLTLTLQSLDQGGVYYERC